MPASEIDHTGMVISLRGILERAADCCKRSRDYKHLPYMLDLLQEHINALRKNPEKVDEFLALWVEE